ncbi:MAG TPA: alpha-hydroxy-acid oxidizing protein [Solirubrobacteraceae bacterium]|jgi:hypothetical protein
MSDEVPYANYQYEIYLRGMTGRRPARTLDWRKLERDAMNLLRKGPRGAVLLGRPYMWGLALGGAEGVVEVLRAFFADLDLAMALSGYANIDEVDARALVVRGR